MKKINESEFGDTYSQRQMVIARWEKLSAEGKWFWIFKRGAAWLASMLFLYGSGLLLFPNILHFEPFQFYILLGMFGGVGFDGTMGYFTQKMGLPWIIGFLVIMGEFFGSLGLLAGLLTRFTAASFIVSMEIACIAIAAAAPKATVAAASRRRRAGDADGDMSAPSGADRAHNLDRQENGRDRQKWRSGEKGGNDRHHRLTSGGVSRVFSFIETKSRRISRNETHFFGWISPTPR